MSLIDEAGSKSYYVLIVDCGGDERVKSVILDQRESLINKQYSAVIGLRDLRPKPRHDYARLCTGMRTRVPTNDLPINFVVAVMEVEAWFIQEWVHYEKIHNTLTADFIKNQIGFDPKTECATNIDQPAEFLDDVYKLVGMRYVKKKNKLSRTVEALDYENIYLNIKDVNPQLGDLINHIDSFLQEAIE